tara:strand:- start:3235 stop:3387 length:153 start_codon:yes stop_codon:yes gene_type:complete
MVAFERHIPLVSIRNHQLQFLFGELKHRSNSFKSGTQLRGCCRVFQHGIY